MRRRARIAGILACFVAAVVLILSAADAARWQDALAADDIRYRDAPEGDLWTPESLVPLGLVSLALGVQDDVAFREALRTFRLSRPGTPSISDPNLVVFKNDAAAQLTDLVEHAKDPTRRSTAANLLGVLSYSEAVFDFTNRERLISNASSRFQQAIALDTENADAKYNLELALALARGIEPTEGGGGANPSPGGKGSKGAGAGDPGSGY
jgi:hypothetical protein